jgi:putative FmdB family regulatory protein
MPIYEYSCQRCGAHLEVMQKVSDKPLARHPRCGGRLEKEWSQTSFQLKGSGWYATDYAGKGQGKQGPKEGKEAAAGKDGQETTKPVAAEAKPKTTTETAAARPAGAPAGGD